MLKQLACAVTLAALAATAAHGEPPTRGVDDVAPGVRVVDGAKVSGNRIDAGALAAAIKDKPSLRVVKKLLTGGVTSPGPGGSTVHMYKLHDTATDKDMIAILFVKGDAIVDHLIQ